MSTLGLRLQYSVERNFGDTLGKVLVEEMSGRRAVFAKHHRAELLAVGSTLYFGHALYCLKSDFLSAYWIRQIVKRLIFGMPTLKVWGSGFIIPRSGDIMLRLCNLDVRCVRGHLTLDALRNLGFVRDGQEIALGDPGLLFPRLLKGSVRKEHEVGVVPHYFDSAMGRKLVAALEGIGVHAHFIDVTREDAIEVVREIGSCERILSSSLHGLITADAFLIPNRHICFSDLGVAKKGFPSDAALFKFKDYFSATGRDYVPILKAEELIDEPMRCLDFVRGGDVISRDRLCELCDGLIQSFPYDVVKGWWEVDG